MKFLEKLKENKKIAVIVLLGLVCVVLLVVSEFVSSTDEVKEQKQDAANIEYSYAEEIEIKLTAMITNISGAGNAKVMVTLESSSESVFAQNRNTNDDKSESEYILIKSGSGQGGMLLKIIAPEVRGVAVICEGASSATVRQEITDMITSVLDINSNRVCVIKMK